MRGVYGTDHPKKNRRWSLWLLLPPRYKMGPEVGGEGEQMILCLLLPPRCRMGPEVA